MHMLRQIFRGFSPAPASKVKWGCLESVPDQTRVLPDPDSSNEPGLELSTPSGHLGCGSAPANFTLVPTTEHRLEVGIS